MKNMHDIDFEKRLLAAALFELRVLLSRYIDHDDNSSASTAGLLAYALHNQALSALDGRPFNVAEALDAVDRLESRLGSKYLQQFRQTVLAGA
jgi:hypothetical protein